MAEVNCGRQKEYDVCKAFFMLMIFVVHVFQICANNQVLTSNAYNIFYSIAVMSGAVVYIFIMGFTMNYTKRQPKAMVCGGIRLICYQFLNNLGYVVAILVGAIISLLYIKVDFAKIFDILKIYACYLNIFFMSGLIYLVLAGLKKLKLPKVGYLILGLAVAIISPFLVLKQTGIPFVDFLIAPFLGGKPYVSFAALPYFAYAFLGVYFGSILIKVENKAKFYQRLLPFCVVVIACFAGYVFVNYHTIAEIAKYLSYGYIYPDIFRVLANIAVTILLASIFYFMGNFIESKKAINKKIEFVSKHVSKYYAIHATVYMFFLGLCGCNSVGIWLCVVFCLLCIVITELVVQSYVRYLEQKKLA